MRAAITDACKKTYTATFAITVPILVNTPAIVCPGQVDNVGYCTVDLNKPVAFAVTGSTPADTWSWQAFVTTNPKVETSSAASFSQIFTDTNRHYLQAFRTTSTGWAVTPLLAVVPASPQRPDITEYADPGDTTVGTQVSLWFHIPAGVPSTAVPSILADDTPLKDVSTAATQALMLARTLSLTGLLTPTGASPIARLPSTSRTPSPGRSLSRVSRVAGGMLLLAFLWWRWRRGRARKRRQRLLREKERIAQQRRAVREGISTRSGFTVGALRWQPGVWPSGGARSWPRRVIYPSARSGLPGTAPGWFGWQPDCFAWCSSGFFCSCVSGASRRWDDCAWCTSDTRFRPMLPPG